MPAWPWAVNSCWWDQTTPAAEVAIVERITDTTPLRRADDAAATGSTEPLFADFAGAFGTNQYEFQADNAHDSSPYLLANRNHDDPALASLVTFLTPIPSERAASHAVVSADIAPSGTSATAAAQVSAVNLTSGPTLGPDPGNAILSASLLSAKVATQFSPRSAAAAQAPVNNSQILEKYGQLPLRFEANQGQTDTRVQFISQGTASTLFLTASEAVLSLQPPANASTAHSASAAGSVLHMQVVGANANSHPVAEQELPGKVNYLLGRDPAHWHTEIPTYAQVEYPNVYNGINLVYYGNQQQLEYDFIVRPGADAANIALRFDTADQMQIDRQGDLVLHTATGAVRQHKPTIYQNAGGIRHEIEGGYVLSGPRQVGFQLGAYDLSLPVVIDPVLSYSTYLGGSMDDAGNAIAVDGAGNVYVTGNTTSPDFPTASPMQASHGGGTSNAFVTKLDPTGTTLLYSTYLGGEGFDRGNGIAVDATGSVYVVGKTNSRLFPITRGAFEDTFRGDEYDAFVTKINPAGDQVSYSTYLGGDANDAGIAIAVDSSGNAYVTGGTKSNDFPVTQSAYQGAINGGPNAFVTELNATGTDLLYSTFLGGSNVDRGNAIAVDANGFVYVTGQTDSDDFPTKNALQANYGGGLDTAFVAKLNPQASGDDSLIYSTFLGGSGKDRGLGIAVDAANNVYVTGATSSAADFPIVNALQPIYGGGYSSAFVTKINSAGTDLLFSTFLGGSGGDGASALALDGDGNIYVTGTTSSADFPTMNALQPLLAGSSDAFVAKLASDGSTLIYSTYLGGSGDENLPQNGVNSGAIAVDAAGAVYVTGNTTSSDFPTVNPVQPMLLGTTNAFVAKIVD
jgi:hypothetical protein